LDVVVVLVFISLMLVFGALVFFASRLKDGDFDHGDRLSLLPLQDDEGTSDEGTSDERMSDEGSVDDADQGIAAATDPIAVPQMPIK
jgi:cbb3-type cytochrome oxidase maturation protein